MDLHLCIIFHVIARPRPGRNNKLTDLQDNNAPALCVFFFFDILCLAS